MLWIESPKIFDEFCRFFDNFRPVLNNDRSMTLPTDLKDHFIINISRALTLSNLKSPTVGVPPFARWIYDSPVRCQSVRIAYEAYHMLKGNKTDAAKKGDIGDMYHIELLPYVDSMVIEKRMGTYARQACQKIGLDFGKKIFTSTSDLLSHLKT